jgi:hypothetical protein
MDMVTPPVVADLQTEVAAGMVERGGGLLDDDVTAGGDVFHDQGSAVIMVTPRPVQYTPFAMSSLGKRVVLGKESHAKQRGEQRGRRCASRLRKNYCGTVEIR